MKYLKFKDNKNRQFFNKVELKNKLKLFIYKNILFHLSYTSALSSNSKKLVFYRVLKKKKQAHLTKIVRRCIITNRSKSFRPFKVSRIVARELMGFGIIPGYTKAVW